MWVEIPTFFIYVGMKTFFTISTWIVIALGLSVVVVLSLAGVYMSAIFVLAVICHIFCVWYLLRKTNNIK
jgi:hypothetical protein